jgi:hypothetical protein
MVIEWSAGSFRRGWTMKSWIIRRPARNGCATRAGCRLATGPTHGGNRSHAVVPAADRVPSTSTGQTLPVRCGSIYRLCRPRTLRKSCGRREPSGGHCRRSLPLSRGREVEMVERVRDNCHAGAWLSIGGRYGVGHFPASDQPRAPPTFGSPQTVVAHSFIRTNPEPLSGDFTRHAHVLGRRR